MAITLIRKMQVLSMKIEVLENTIYDAELDAKVASILDDDAMATGAKSNMKRALKALDSLQKLYSELAKDSGGEITNG